MINSTVAKILPCAEEAYNKFMAAQWRNEAQMCATGAATGFKCTHMAAACEEIAATFEE